MNKVKSSKGKYKNNSLKGALIVIGILSLAAALIYYNPSLISDPLKMGSKQDLPQPTMEMAGASVTPTDAEAATQTKIHNNSDPIVSCDLYSCGTVKMKSSECRISGCCIIGTEKKVMNNQAACNELQKEYAQSHPSQNTNSTNYLMERAKIDAKGLTAQTCIDKAGYEAQRCSQDCEGPLNYGRNACKTAMDGLDWTTERYSECLDENSDIYSQCLDKCTNDMAAKQNICLEQQKQ